MNFDKNISYDAYQRQIASNRFERMNWFRAARYGLFIHYGLYSQLGRGEWVQVEEDIDPDTYAKLADTFSPKEGCCREWAKLAKEAGMKYMVLTTRHHEGFSLWDSKVNPFNSVNYGPKRDIVREFVDACREYGLRIGLYSSLTDWHHPDCYRSAYDEDARKRFTQYLYDLNEELLTNYGKIDILWFDYSYKRSAKNSNLPEWMQGKGREDWESEKLIATARALQPEIIIDNRADMEQDLWTPEQYQPTKWVTHEQTGELVTWEACQTFSGSWGYYRDEMTWKSPEMLVQMLINTVSIGGNLLMNVGPTARGYFDYRAEAALKAYADWMKYNSRSIYGCTMAEPELLALCPNGCKFTQSEDGKRLYIHLFSYPFGYLELPGFAGKVDYTQFLHDNSELLFEEKTISHFSEGRTASDDLLVIKLPHVKPPVIVPVIEVFLK